MDLGSDPNSSPSFVGHIAEDVNFPSMHGTYVGGKARNQKSKVPPKEAVVSLVEREGRVSPHHVPEVTAKTLRPILASHIDRKSYLMTDESLVYPTVGHEFSGHGNHSIEEYVSALAVSTIPTR
jgi:ISXO2-like transposase domain